MFRNIIRSRIRSQCVKNSAFSSQKRIITESFGRYVPQYVRSLTSSSYRANKIPTEISLENAHDFDASDYSCSSCGVNLQSENPTKTGYFQLPKESVRSYVTEKRLQESKYDTLLSRYSSEDLKLLNNTSEFSLQDQEFRKDNDIPSIPQLGLKEAQAELEISLQYDQDDRMVCKRCHDTLFHSKFNPEELTVESVDNILSTIPQFASVAYVINSIDFPLTIRRDVLERIDIKRLYFIVTKADLIFRDSKNLEIYEAYFKKFLINLGASPDKIVVVSGKNNWNIKNLMAILPKKTYFIGDVNSGKSTLVNSLLYTDKRIEGKTVFKVQDQIRSGPGVSHIPSFTRDHLQYNILNNLKQVIDVPGFGDPSHGIFQHLDQLQLRNIGKASKVYKKSLHDSHYTSIKGGKCYTVGGFFYLVPPEGVIAQVRNNIAAGENNFRNLETAMKAVSEQPKELKYVFSVKPESANGLQRFVIPDFYGSIDLVIKNVGFINIKPTGAKSEGFWEVYLPKGVQAMIRDPIVPYISKTISKYDKKGNKLKNPQEIFKKGVKVVKDLPKNRPLFSHLLEYNSDSAADMSRYAQSYWNYHRDELICDRDQIDRRHDNLDRNSGLPKNYYWLDKLL